MCILRTADRNVVTSGVTWFVLIKHLKFKKLFGTSSTSLSSRAEFRAMTANVFRQECFSVSQHWDLVIGIADTRPLVTAAYLHAYLRILTVDSLFPANAKAGSHYHGCNGMATGLLMFYSPHAPAQKEYKGIIQDVFNASKEIKVLRLFVSEPGFYFKAGQWVDFYVPGIPEVTGYSMTSAPYEAKEKGILDLAVKYGKFPPTHWVHTKCLGGEEVTIRVGGDFYYDPQPGTPAATADLLLIGGGVGINPLVSILHQYCHILETKNDFETSPGKLHLMYSAKTEEELIFKDTFMLMEEKHPSLTCSYFITRNNITHSDPNIKYSRIQAQDILDALKNLRMENILCYVCGPSTMTDDVTGLLSKIGIQKEYIKFEKWW